MKEYFESLMEQIRSVFSKNEIRSESQNLTDDDIFNAKKLQKEKELNRILDKINRKGIESLSQKEKQFLDSMN